MASDHHAPGFVPGQGFTQEDWDEVCDSPELTAELFARSRPLAETRPDLVEAVRRRRGNPRVATKDLVSLRLDKDVLAELRAGGPGWQTTCCGKASVSNRHAKQGRAERIKGTGWCAYSGWTQAL